MSFRWATIVLMAAALVASGLVLGIPDSDAGGFREVRVSAETVAVRSGPGTEHEVWFEVTRGEPLLIIEAHESSWIRVFCRSEKMGGWIQRKYVTTRLPRPEGHGSFAGFEYSYDRRGLMCRVYVSPPMRDDEDAGPILVSVANSEFAAGLEGESWPMLVRQLADTVYVFGADARFGFCVDRADTTGAYSLRTWMEKY